MSSVTARDTNDDDAGGGGSYVVSILLQFNCQRQLSYLPPLFVSHLKHIPHRLCTHRFLHIQLPVHA